MAEGFATQRFGDRAKITSAGIEAHGINPRAIATMREVQIDISQQSSDIVSEHMLAEADIVVTLCGDARDTCPKLPANTVHHHWGLADPAKASGNEEEIRQTFRQVRDEIKHRIDRLATQLG